MYQRAATDITNGHAFDSYFRNERQDPWARQAVQRFTDLAINHAVVVFPQPSKAALDADSDEHLPAIFAVGRKPTWGLVAALQDAAADSVPLDQPTVSDHFTVFADWLRGNKSDLFRLKRWLEMHDKEPRVADAHSITVPKHLVTDFMAELPAAALALELGLTDAGLEYAFDVFVRGIQYNSVCGESAPYFPHPVRDELKLHESVVSFESQSAWSWGAYLATLMAAENKYRTLDTALEIIQAIKTRALTQASWYHLAGIAPSDQLEAIRTVASECGLPAKLRESTQKAAETNFKGLGLLKGAGVAGGTALAAKGVAALVGGLSVGLLIAAGSFALAERTKGYLPGAFSRAKVLKGRLEWPDLIKNGAA